MTRIAREQVERVALLARLELEADEAELLTGHLDAILDYVETLAEIDTTGVEPTSHAIPLATPLREDEPETPMDPERALRNAPVRDGSAFVVPKVLDEDET